MIQTVYQVAATTDSSITNLKGGHNPLPTTNRQSDSEVGNCYKIQALGKILSPTVNKKESPGNFLQIPLWSIASNGHVTISWGLLLKAKTHLRISLRCWSLDIYNLKSKSEIINPVSWQWRSLHAII